MPRTKHPLSPVISVPNVKDIDPSTGLPRRIVSYPTDYGKSRTVQSDKLSCDINTIIRKYTETGYLPPSAVNSRTPLYADVSELPSDYAESLNLVRDFRARFESLPAVVRNKFKSPEAFMEFVSTASTNHANARELVRLGLAELSPASLELVKRQAAREAARASAGGKGAAAPQGAAAAPATPPKAS